MGNDEARVMGMLLRVVLLLLALVGTASAECAWVLWTKINALQWEARGGYDTRAACELERVKSVEGVHQGTGGSQFVVLNVCLPESVDPRAPKAQRSQ